ncbi:type I-E CRISPR-associated protein Cas6/Cse3/CasE [Streptomyces hainanensis]|uniref:Type I-E CRISPR-associated protein Cas6/Cse3/CasE n=1 Tax=Streptomyces hainanensis TaxID=402648 RepID=A0A4R4TKD9_9ACTN|nr:type I-E CRISPR-associated protein Cas6/Cse3/CasE [Streptomyces hainanensis]TDC78267.1 type I-E CRISPR-associated protein Cas6/Cse3/CasE [Streptomyces hainanensis]
MSIAAPPAALHAAHTAWLTQLLLNSASHSVRRDLSDAAALHRRVMQLLPDDDFGDSPRSRAGILFRLETNALGGLLLLVQSRTPLDPELLPPGYAETRSKDMSPLLTALRPGFVVRYRLLGNTIRRCGRNSTEGRWKQAIPLHGQDADNWWAQRAPAAGLMPHTILSEPGEALTAWHRIHDRTSATPEAKPSKTPRRQENHVRVPHQTTRFEGTATIRDADALREALLTGIGRGKSYGCGLLSIAPTALGA